MCWSRFSKKSELQFESKLSVAPPDFLCSPSSSRVQQLHPKARAEPHSRGRTATVLHQEATTTRGVMQIVRIKYHHVEERIHRKKNEGRNGSVWSCVEVFVVTDSTDVSLECAAAAAAAVE